MAAVNTPFDLIEDSGAETTGTWSVVSRPSGAGAGSNAPGTYNGTVDFTGEPVGDYVYEYDVNSGADTSQVTYTWNGTSTARFNDDCSNAQFMISPNRTSFIYTLTDQDNLEDCAAGIAAPTDSGVTKPANWGAGPFNGEDLWYTMLLDFSSTDAYVVVFEVTGAPYGQDGIQKPVIQLYSGDLADNCSTFTLEYSSTPGVNQRAVASVSIAASTPSVVWLRVASYEAGKFDIKVTST